MRVVLDASVIAKWVLPAASGEEPDADRALAILDEIRSGALEVLQPPHWLAEVAAVVVRLVPGSAGVVLDLFDAMELPETTDVAVYRRAASLADALDHHLFDTLYHAVALGHEATLITADERYWRKARDEGSIRRLAEWTPG